MKPALIYVLRAVLVAAVGAIAQAIINSFDQHNGNRDQHQEHWDD